MDSPVVRAGARLMGVTTPSHRRQIYRERGWWPGERLDERYQRHVQARPKSLAIADSVGRELTHGELWQRSADLAELLAEQGVTSGDTVLLFLPNRVEWQIALLATLRLHAVPASIPTKTDPLTLAYAARLVGCAAVLTAQSERGDHLVDTVVTATDELDDPTPILCIGADGAHRWVIDAVPRNSDIAATRDLDHIMFTSSTTGLPKGVAHTADTLAALNIHFAERFGLGPTTPIFMGSPLGHSVGGIHGARLALHTGAALVLQETWDPSSALQLIETYQCNFTAAATPFLKDFVEAAGKADASTLPLRTFLCGGAPVPPALLEEAEARFPNTFVTNLWGMTEGGLVTCVPGGPKEKLIQTAGIGLPGLELQVRNADDSVAESGCEGELAMRGPGVFVGYFGQDDVYDAALTDDGFFRTGDLAVIDEAGYVRITGRLKDLIIRGGGNISPLPTEDALASHPGVKSVAVVGFPDERLGERICAVVEPAGGAPSLEELISFATERGLAKRQWPEVVRYIDAMPRTAAGKIRKPILHELITQSAADSMTLEVNDD